MSAERATDPRALWASAGAGVLFALGLGLSGMTNPARVLGFLDVTGAWDPRLAGVMGGAVLLGLGSFAWVLRRPRPLLDPQFHLPTQRAVDARLIIGAVLFGAGWALAGYCPGPAVVSLATGAPEVWLFVAAMLAGIGIVRLWEHHATKDATARDSLLPMAVPTLRGSLEGRSSVAGPRQRAPGAAAHLAG